jgi:hypothetical protein
MVTRLLFAESWVERYTGYALVEKWRLMYEREQVQDIRSICTSDTR